MKAAYELPTADGSGFRPNEQEAFDLREDASLPLAELRQIKPQMTRKSRKQLEATRKEVAHIRRTIDEIGNRIDVKNVALNRLLDVAPAKGESPDRKPVLAFKPGARPGVDTP
jgi:hypothetical protein